jgi:outer membrane protein TolC
MLSSDRPSETPSGASCKRVSIASIMASSEVDSLTRSRDLSQRAYEDGAIPLTDVLDANRELLSARDELDLTQTAAARAAVRTFRALGGGWDPS